VVSLLGTVYAYEGQEVTEESTIIELMFQELFSLEEGLSEWEMTFLDSAYESFKKFKGLTPKQKSKLDEIYEDRIS